MGQIIKVFITIFSCLAGGYGALNVFLWIITCIMVSEDRDFFDGEVDYIWSGHNTQVGYQDVQMSFDKWKNLFELDPTQFGFLNRRNGNLVGLHDLDTKFRKCHPVFKSPEGVFYVIDFKGTEYKKYWEYEDELVSKLSAVHEDKITKYIVGDIQDKLDAIIEESQAQVQRSLDLQHEIVLRLQEDVKED